MTTRTHEAVDHLFDSMIATSMALVERLEEQIGTHLNDWPVGSPIKSLRTALATFRLTVEACCKEEEARRTTEGEEPAPVQEVLGNAFRQLLGNLDGGDEPEASGSAGMDEGDSLVFTGSITVPEALLFLAQTQKTGTVLIPTQTESFTIELIQGSVVHAVSDSSPVGFRLGEILVAQGAIREYTLRQFLEQHAADRRRIGEALEREEIVSHEQLHAALCEQARGLFRRCAEADVLRVEFRPRRFSADHGDVRLELAELLLEDTAKG